MVPGRKGVTPLSISPERKCLDEAVQYASYAKCGSGRKNQKVI